MIRVLHFGLGSSLGGIETYLRKISNHINKDKFQFDFLVMENAKPCWYDEFLAMGSRFYKVTQRSENPLKNRKELIELFKNEKFDIVHCHMNSLSNLLPITIALKYNNRVIVHSRNANTPNSFKTRILHSLNSLVLPKDKVIKVGVSQKAGKWMFGDKDDFTVINNGINIGDFKYYDYSRFKIRKELGIDENQFCVAHIGALRYQKNHLFLLEVFKSISQLKPNSLLLLVGSGKLKTTIQDHAMKLGISNKILMVGNRDDVSDLLSASDCFLFPSFYEGFPNAVLEAQTSGLPCLISDTITSEVIINGNCENFSLNKSPKDWAQKLLSLTSLENRISGSEKVNQQGFSVQDEIKKLEQLYFNSI